jgi:hypothetical protein
LTRLATDFRSAMRSPTFEFMPIALTVS